MKQSTRKALYALHSWCGLVTGLLMYIIAFSGVVALFVAELGPWDRGESAAPPPASPAGLDRVVKEMAAQQPGKPLSMTVLLPTDYRAALTVERGAEHSDAAPVTHHDPVSGQPVQPGGTAVLEVLTRLHTDLLLPAPFGRYLVGLLGVIMLLLIISGVVLHRKLLSQLFTLRLHRSRRLLWSDTHKSLGLWALPFHFIMALTGAILGLVGLVLMLAAVTAFRGDAEAAAAALSGTAPIAARGEPAPMRPPSELIAAARRALPGLQPAVATIQHYGDKAGHITVYGNVPGRLVYFPAVTLSLHNAEVLHVVDWSREDPGRRLYAMVTPLHYGSFGGLVIKILYAALGIGTCLVVVSGLRIWLSRPLGPEARGHRLTLTLIDPVVLGLPLATAACFFTSRLLPQPLAADSRTITALLLGLWALTLPWLLRAPKTHRVQLAALLATALLGGAIGLR